MDVQDHIFVATTSKKSDFLFFLRERKLILLGKKGKEMKNALFVVAHPSWHHLVDFALLSF